MPSTPLSTADDLPTTIRSRAADGEGRNVTSAAYHRTCLAFLSTFNQACGIATHTRDLIEGLRAAAEQLGVDLDIVVLAEAREELLQPDPPWVYRCWHRWTFDVDKALEAVAERGVDILHIQFQSGLFQHTDLVHLLRACRLRGVRLFGTFHSMEDHLACAAEAARLMDRAFVHLDQGAIRLVAHGAHADSLRVIPHGVRVRRSSRDAALTKMALGLPETSRLITSFGFFEPQKGILEIILALPRVLERHPETYFVFAGARHPYSSTTAAEYRDECRRLVASLGLQKHALFVEKFLPDEEVGHYVAASDLVVFNYTQVRNEVSGAAAFVLGYGRPLVTSFMPTFVPLLDCSLQTSMEMDLARAMNLVLEQPELASHMQSRARDCAEAQSFVRVGQLLLAEYGLTP